MSGDRGTMLLLDAYTQWVAGKLPPFLVRTLLTLSLQTTSSAPLPPH